ncbi:putative membrane protein [Wenyingzhuangia aestuarii]|nr:putative membrane protein [Wenyingzhuangia aestuarii]
MRKKRNWLKRPTKKLIINATTIWFLITFSFYFTVNDILNESFIQSKFSFMYFLIATYGILNYKLIQNYYFRTRFSHIYYRK